MLSPIRSTYHTNEPYFHMEYVYGSICRIIANYFSLVCTLSSIIRKIYSSAIKCACSFDIHTLQIDTTERNILRMFSTRSSYKQIDKILNTIIING